MGLGMQELVFLMVIIAVLSATGLWPRIIRGLRELRGERVEDPAPAAPHEMDLCYKILGLSPSASWKEVERAYRQKAKRHHPDLGGDEDAMRALNDAYTRIKQARHPR
jgi:DnaJ-domain-containing protein 1